MKKENTPRHEEELDDEQYAENLTDLVSIINAKGDTKKIEKIIAENKSCCDDKSES